MSRVLVVDSEYLVAEHLADAVRFCGGHDVSIASRADYALSEAVRVRPDVVVLGPGPPCASCSVALLGRLMEELGDVPAIVMTRDPEPPPLPRSAVSLCAHVSVEEFAQAFEEVIARPLP